MAVWQGIEVTVLSATYQEQPAEDILFEEGMGPVPDELIQVRITFLVEGPIGPSDPSWGPMAEAIVPMTEVSGRIAYPIKDGFFIMRGA